ncbi:MAG: hypothetical protein AB1782_01925 [Cyanobacteriota bacterium]
MNCNDAYILANLYIDNQLTEDEFNEFEIHIQSCECCKESFNQLNDLNKLLVEDNIEIPFDLTEIILNKISIYRLKERYEENNKLKIILLIETIFVIVVTILSLPQLLTNISDVLSSIQGYYVNLNEFNGFIVSNTIKAISYINTFYPDNVSSSIYISVFILCIIFNVVLVNNLRRQII